VLIGTVGLAAEWGWSHVWMPIPWPSEILGETIVLGLAMALAAHDPARTLERGYALVTDVAGEPVTTAAAARAAGDVSLRFGDAAVDATITDSA